MKRSAILVAVFLGLTALPAAAVQPDEILGDAALEARARGLSAGLRCLVCQNQSIDDSDAPLARDIRVLVRERLQAGESDATVRDFLVSRYGAFILLKPPLELGTALLWATPPLVLLGGLGALLFTARRGRRSLGHAAPLNEDERHRLDELLRS